MFNRLSTATRLVALIFLISFTLDVESVTVKGRLRNYSIKTKCLRPVGQNNGDGLEIVDCSGSADQIMEANGFKNLESEAGYIQFDVGGKCLSLNGFSSDNEVRVLIWDCVGQDNQRWKVINGNTGGSFELQLKSTGKCLTAENGGAYLDQYECYGIGSAPHQYWTLDLIDNVPAPSPQPGGAYNALLRNYAHNTKCLYAKGDGNGAELELVDCSSTSTDQLIKLDSFQNIKNEAAYVRFDANGKCLSLNGLSSDNEVRVLIWDCVDQDNQKWKVINGDTGGSFELQLKSSGKCLTAESGGTYLDQYECYGIGSAPHQYWTLNVISGGTPAPPQPGAATRGLLRNYAHNTKCLHAKGDANGAQLEVVDCSSSSADQFIRMDSFKNIQNEAAYVQFDVSGKCLSLNGVSSDNEVRVLIWDCVDQDNQKWKVINGNTGGSFELQLKSSGKCLTAEAGGTYLDQYECYGIGSAPHQYWTIDSIGGGTNTGDGDTIDVNPYTFYQLESYNSPDKCLRYKDGSGSNYALELVTCDPEDLSQRMLPFTRYHNHQLGYSGIQFISTSKCLDVSGASNSNGASVGQNGCVDQSHQRWRMENFDFNDNTFRIRSELGEKCLTSEGGGTYMDIWDCYGKSSAPHQYWKQRNPNAKRVGGPKLHVLQNYNWPDKCLHPVGSSSENGGELELIDCNSIKPEESTNTDEWQNYDTAPGYVKFNNKCLSTNGMSSDNGVRLVQWDCVGQANQRWQIVNGNIDSSFQLKSEHSGKCLTAEGGGTFMDQWDCSGTAAAPHQSWMIKTIGSGGNEYDDDQTLDVENFFAPDGALIEVVDKPGKCLRVDTGTNEVVLAACSQYDEDQLFDHSDLLNYNSNPGLLKALNGKCVKANGDGHVKVVDCDITDLNELWFVVLGTVLGSFKLKASQSTNCLSTADDGSYSGTTDCFPTSDSRKKRDLSPRALLRLSYKMSRPTGNRLYLIRSAFYYGYCLTRDGASSWPNSKLGIQDCDQNDDRQRWHFEQWGPTFQNKFYVRNGAKCLRVNGNAVGDTVDHQADCQQSNEYIFKFQAYGSQNSFYSLQNVASGLCINVNWSQDKDGTFVDYIEQQPCNQVGTSAFVSNPIYDVEDWKCGPLYGGKFCTGKYKGMCCSKHGGCGETVDYCGKLKCDSRYGPCIKSLNVWPNLDMRCGPFIAEYANRRGTCQGIYTQSGYCCSMYGVCGNTPEYCLAENCDSEYGSCPQYAENQHPDKCGILWGNKRCSGANNEQCCSKAEDRIEMGTCGAGPYHCRGRYCDAEHGACPADNWCGWLNNKRRLCPAGECCSLQNECGTSEKYCGANCDIQIAPPRGGLTTKSVGFYPEPYGTCITTSDSFENEPCAIRERCQAGLVCTADADNPRTKKCVRA